jgi:hypothetical protein
MDQWRIHLESWIIEDGNYPDFVRGTTVEFAVELFTKNLRPSSERIHRARAIEGDGYEIIGEVIYGRRGIWIVDFGLLAFGGSKTFGGLRLPERIRRGDYVTATGALGIDESSYFEHFSKREDIPGIIYTWRIDRICMQTAPFIEYHSPEGPRLLMRDEDQLGYKDIERTDAGHDDGGHAEYLLYCTRLDVPPKHSSATALV